MKTWAATGVVNLHMVFSQYEGHPHKYVQDAIWQRVKRFGQWSKMAAKLSCAVTAALSYPG